MVLRGGRPHQHALFLCDWMFHRKGLLPEDQLLSLLLCGRSGVAQHGYLLLHFQDMLPFKQLCVNLLGTSCSRGFMMLFCFPLCPQPLPFRGKRPWIRSSGVEHNFSLGIPRALQSSECDSLFHVPLSKSCRDPSQDPGHRILEQQYSPSPLPHLWLLEVRQCTLPICIHWAPMNSPSSIWCDQIL